MFRYKDYEESEALKKLAAEYRAKKAAAPTQFKSGFETQMDSVLQQIRDRKKFSYDATTDPFYKQYEDIYKKNAKLAMQDSMGQAASLTGGYGNSYAQAVGQQAYNDQMQSLNNVVPELYQLALSRYQQEGQDLMDKYGMLSAADATAYARYRDSVADYQNELARLAAEYADERSIDYSRYAADRELAANDYQFSASLAEDRAKRELDTLITIGDYDALDKLGYDTTQLRAAAETERNAALKGMGLTTDDMVALRKLKDVDDIGEKIDEYVNEGKINEDTANILMEALTGGEGVEGEEDEELLSIISQIIGGAPFLSGKKKSKK